MIRTILQSLGVVAAMDPPKGALQAPDWNTLPARPCSLADPTGGPSCGPGYGSAWTPQDGAGSITYTPYDAEPVAIDTIHPVQPLQPDYTPFNVRLGLVPDPTWDPSVIVNG